MKKLTRTDAGFSLLRIGSALAVCSAALLLLVAAVAHAQAPTPGRGTPKKNGWKSIDEQLAERYLGRSVHRGTALEALIRANQNFALLREDEKNDKRGLPPWLRVWWRKNHPDGRYSAEDPTGGYPHVLKEVLEWMMTHQDLKSGPGADAEAEATSADTDEPSLGGANTRISGAQTSARSEADIRVNYWDTDRIVSGSNNISASGQQAMFYSIDGGASWSQTLLPLQTGDAFHSDPTVEWTSDGRAWSSTLGINSSATQLRLRNYYSTDNGATWTFDATASGTQTAVDKQMVWVDHSSSPHANQMYAIWHNNEPAFMNRRTAGPLGTWLATPIQVSGAESTGTCIGSDVKTNSAGDVFGAWPTTGNRKIFIVKSTNGGASYTAPVQIATTYDAYDIGVPAFNGRRALIYVSIGAYRTATKNNVYATWVDLSGETGCTAAGNEPGSNVSSPCKTRVWFSRSTNGGTTWSAPVKINNQSGLNDQFNQWMVVDEATGGLAVIYYDTVGDSGRKKTDVWYQSSPDDGETWSAPLKITTAMTDETSAGANTGNQYGDYNGLSGYANKLFPSWTDRRNNAREEIWTAQINDPFLPATPAPNVVSTSSSLARGQLNPGEVVTVSLCLQNTGTAAATNVVGTLQSSGGVTFPAAAQNYGTMPAGGAPVCREYTFVVSSALACGANITPALALQDDATSFSPVTFSLQTGTDVITARESFDNVSAPALPAESVATNAAGASPLWVTTANTPATAPNAAFVNDPATVSDKRLETAPFVVTGTDAQLTFRNKYMLEAGSAFYDGGVLEISAPNINGGVFTDVTAAAVGGSFVSGGYVGAISGSYSNPLAGREAWSGDSGGYIDTVVNLGPHVAGQTIKLRFRMGSDTSTAGPGWWVDDLRVSYRSCAPLRVTSGSRLPSGAFRVNANGFANGTHTIQAAPNFEPGSFTPIGTATADSNGALQFDDPGATSFDRRFYRVTYP